MLSGNGVHFGKKNVIKMKCSSVFSLLLIIQFSLHGDLEMAVRLRKTYVSQHMGTPVLCERTAVI